MGVIPEHHTDGKLLVKGFGGNMEQQERGGVLGAADPV